MEWILQNLLVFLSELPEVLSSVSTGTSVKANFSRAKWKSVAGVSSMHQSLGNRGFLPLPDSPGSPRSWLMGFGGFPQMELEFRVKPTWPGCFGLKHSKHRTRPAVFYSVSLVLLLFRAPCESRSCISHTHCHGNGVECPKSALSCHSSIDRDVGLGKINLNHLQG